MIIAEWNGERIAAASATETVEGNHYFPPTAVEMTYLEPSSHRSTCPWKGEAHYYHVVVGDKRNENAAWYYPQPKPAADNIKDYVAFWKGVEVRQASD